MSTQCRMCLQYGCISPGANIYLARMTTLAAPDLQLAAGADAHPLVPAQRTMRHADPTALWRVHLQVWMVSPVRKEADLPLAVTVLHVATQLCAVSAGMQPVLEERVAVGAVIATWASATLHRKQQRCTRGGRGQAKSNVGTMRGQAKSNVGTMCLALQSSRCSKGCPCRNGPCQAAARLK
jgi:hypothetical protein